MQFAGGAAAGVDELAFDGDGERRVAVGFGEVEVCGDAAEEVIGFAVVEAVLPGAGSGEPEDLEEARVDVRGFVDPVVVGSREAVGVVEPGVHYQGGGEGEDGWVHGFREEFGQFGVRVGGVVAGGLRACPECDE